MVPAQRRHEPARRTAMGSTPTLSEMIMWQERDLDLAAFERARRSGVVEHGLPRGDGLRARLASALLALAVRLDRTAMQRTAARLAARGA
jgi:hypothetical protein